MTPTPSPLWDVLTNHGPIELYAPTRTEAIQSALELHGPNATLVRCTLHDEWIDHIATATFA
jgi:hypothetical protein